MRQKNPDIVHSGEGNDKIGPGHYSYVSPMGLNKNQRGAKWHLSKSKRSPVERLALP